MTLDYRQLAMTAVMFFLVSCGNDSSESMSDTEQGPKLSAATLGKQEIHDARTYLEAEPYASADRGRGRDQALICRACHSLEAGGPNMIGPALHGVFGRAAGSQNGFDYSPVLKNAGFVWTPRALDAWLAQPGTFLPGNRMAFAGVSNQGDREDLIAYLLEATATVESAWN